MMRSIRNVAIVGAAAAVVACSIAAGSALRAKQFSMRHIADIPLPGGATRFDYQSLDPETGRLYLSHMGDGRLVVFDTKANKVVADLPDFPRFTGVLFVPAQKKVYASAAGAHEVVVVNAVTLKTIARIPGADFPDGLAYAPEEQKVFVSDESGGADLVIDARTNKRLGVIKLAGEAGNTQYDAASKHIFVAVQTKNQVTEIDPKTDKIVAVHPLPGSDHPHGFYIDSPNRLMFMSCEGNNKLLVVDMRTMKVIQTEPVIEGPDVLAFDPGLNLLYVASEGGGVTVFKEKGRRLAKVAEVKAPNAHSVSVDPRTHRIYLPLKNVGGRPVLRIMEPSLGR